MNSLEIGHLNFSETSIIISLFVLCLFLAEEKDAEEMQSSKVMFLLDQKMYLQKLIELQQAEHVTRSHFRISFMVIQRF